MKIWVDADACPVVAKEILFRAADRTGMQLTLVANQALSTPASPNINSVQVMRGFDVADDEIVKRLEAGDLVITSDIPLAAEVIEKGGNWLCMETLIEACRNRKFSISRLAPYLGELARDERHHATEADGARWLEVVRDGSAVCAFGTGASINCGGTNRTAAETCG